MAEAIYHFLPQSEYLFDEEENITRPSLIQEGFIHCSTRQQVCEVAGRLVSKREDIMLVKIDPSQIPFKIIYENLEGGEQLFPHIYGPIPRHAILGVAPFGWNTTEQHFDFPAKFDRIDERRWVR